MKDFSRVNPVGEDARRYVNYPNLAGVTLSAPKRIILRREDIARLSNDYEIQVPAEADPLVYATIKRRL